MSGLTVARIQQFCLSLPGAWPDNPWDHDYPGEVTVMAYLGRSGWNTMKFGGGIPDEEILDAIEDSYDRVVRKLPMRLRPVRPD